MATYTYQASQLTVTLPTGTRAATAKREGKIAAVLTHQPVRIVAATDARHRAVLTATWTRTPTAGDLSAAKTAVVKAVPAAAVTVRTVTTVGITWTATSVLVPATSAARQLRAALSATVPGRYTITVRGKTFTVTWAQPGLTTVGLAKITAIVAQHAALTTDRVRVAALT